MTDTRDDFVFSLKPHVGYDAPLLVVKAGSPEEMVGKLAALGRANLWAAVADADTELKAAWNLAKAFDVEPVADTAYQGQPAQYTPPPAQYQPPPAQPAPAQGAPTGRQAPPPGAVAPNCPHGTKTYVVGQYGPFWGCPGRREDPSRCKPEKIRN